MTDLLGESGLNEPAARVYLAALEAGTVNVSRLVEKLKAPRGTVYLLLDELLSKGFIATSKHGKTRLVTAAPPERILKALEERQRISTQAIQKFKQLLPELKTMENTRLEKPKVRYFEGNEGIKTAFEDTLDAKEILIHCSGGERDGYWDKDLNTYMNRYFRQVATKNITTRELIAQQSSLDEYLHLIGPKQQVKILPPPQAGTTHVDTMIYEHKIALVAFEGRHSVVIEDPRLADAQRQWFNLLWQRL